MSKNILFVVLIISLAFNIAFLGVFIYLNCGNPFFSSDNVHDIIELSQISSVSKIHFIDQCSPREWSLF